MLDRQDFLLYRALVADAAPSRAGQGDLSRDPARVRRSEAPASFRLK